MIVVDLLYGLEVDHSFQLRLVFICYHGNNTTSGLTRLITSGYTSNRGVPRSDLRSKTASCGYGRRRTSASSTSLSFLPSWWGSRDTSSPWWRCGSKSQCCVRLTRCGPAGQSRPSSQAGNGSADETVMRWGSRVKRGEERIEGSVWSNTAREMTKKYISTLGSMNMHEYAN